MYFREDIEDVINKHSRENGSATPDFILAQYLVSCLETFDIAVKAREKWYGRSGESGAPESSPSNTASTPPP